MAAKDRQRAKRQREAEAAQAGDEGAQRRRASRSEQLWQRFGDPTQQAARRAWRRSAALDPNHPSHATAAAALQREAERSHSRRADERPPTSFDTASAKVAAADRLKQILFGRLIDIPENGWEGYEHATTYVTGTIMDFRATGMGNRFFVEFPAGGHICLSWAQLRGKSPWGLSPPTSVPRLRSLVEPGTLATASLRSSWAQRERRA